MTLTGGLAYLIGTLDPFEAATAGGTCVLDHTHDAVHRRDTRTGLLERGVAASGVSRTREREYVLELRHDAVFHDGSRVESGDVAASIQAMLAAGSSKSRLLGGQLSGILRAAPLDASHVRIETRTAQPLLDERLALVRVVPEAYARPGDAERAPGTGPFRLVSGSEREAVLEPAGHASPRAQPVRLAAVVDAGERVAGLLDGSLVAIEDPPVPAHQRLLDSGRRVEWMPSQNILWLMFNCSDPRLADPRVRRAIVHALDPAELSRRANAGRLATADSLLPEWHPDHAASPAHPRHDPERARLLLREAGYGDGLSLRLLVSSVSWVIANGELVVEQLREAGIEAEVTIAHTSQLFSREIPEADYEVLLSSGDPSYFGVDGEFILRWYLSGAWARDYCHAGGPDVDELERLLDEARSTEDPEQRRAVLAAVQQRAAEALFIAAIGHRQQPTAWSAALHGFAPARTTGLSFR